MYLHFALGKAYGDLEDHERSFRHLIEGNALKRQQTPYDEAAVRDLFGRIRAVFTPELIREKRGLGDPSPVPVFIIGMPRSGTSLIEGSGQVTQRCLAPENSGSLAVPSRRYAGRTVVRRSFPEAVLSMGGEQLRELGASYVAAIRDLAPKAERITDKMPLNFVLPASSIWHCRTRASFMCDAIRSTPASRVSLNCLLASSPIATTSPNWVAFTATMKL